jgi:hypothetical protein
MKKLTALIAVLLLACTFVFADVAVKDLGDGTAEVTFFYGNPRASEVVIAGSWTDWQNAAEPMTKTDKGWEYTKVFSHDDELKYKFISDGNWTPDINAPDSIDDGFGGKNGLVEVGVLAAIEAAKATGDTSALEALTAGKSGLRFGTYTQVILSSDFLTRSLADPTVTGFETDKVSLTAKSYWKLSGNILNNTPVFIEIKAFDGGQDLYRVNPTGGVDVEAVDGVKNMFTGLLFHPFSWMNGGLPELGHFKVGVDTAYVNLETAYKWAKPSKREAILWTTVKDGDANDGYFQFTNGSAIQNFGDISLDVGIVPNKTLGKLGLRSWANVGYADQVYVDVQWDAKSNATEQTVDTFFDDFEGDIIFGAKWSDFGVDLKAQMLTALGSKEVKDALGYKVAAGYSQDIFGVNASFGSYQPNVSMLYGDNDNFSAGDSVIEVNPWTAPLDGLKLGVDFSLKTTYEFKFDAKNNKDFKPWVNLNLEPLAGLNATADLYAKMAFDANAKEDAFSFNEFGLKYGMTEVSDIIPAFSVNYTLNLGDVKSLHSVFANLSTAPGINVDLGFLLRLMASDAEQAEIDKNALFGFFLGANYKLAALKDAKLFGDFVFNMDPFDGDSVDNEKIDQFAGKARFRLGLTWDF